MVFGKKSETSVPGLRGGEDVLWSIDYKDDKKQKNLMVLTNQRVFVLNKKMNTVSHEHSISDITIVVSDKWIDGGKYSSTPHGMLNIFHNGKKIMWAGAEDPDGIVNLVRQYQTHSSERFISNSYQTNSSRNQEITYPTSTKGSLPKGYDQQSTPQTTQSLEDPMKILKLRYAKGEITKEQFEEMKEMLE
ncbi:MAG TPA: SHOCT domain-containing protein [Nitrosarchaeum sp.]